MTSGRFVIHWACAEDSNSSAVKRPSRVPNLAADWVASCRLFLLAVALRPLYVIFVAMVKSTDRLQDGLVRESIVEQVALVRTAFQLTAGKKWGDYRSVVPIDDVSLLLIIWCPIFKKKS